MAATTDTAQNGGLTEPLLPNSSSSSSSSSSSNTPTASNRAEQPQPPQGSNTNNEDVENGLAVVEPDSNTNDSNGDDDNSESATLPILRRAYRRSGMALAFIDLVGLFCLTYVFYGWKFMISYLPIPPFQPYHFESSLVDVVWLTAARTLLLTVQTSRFPSVRATKVAGYFCLLSCLALVTKLAVVSANVVVIDGHAHLGTMLLVIYSLAFSLMQGVCEFLIGVYGSEGDAIGVAEATTAGAARGTADSLAFDDEQTIGLWKLMLVLKPYFWPDGFLNRLCVLVTWIFVGLSKAANILAPLCIARATDALSHGKHLATTKYIILYTAFLFANKLFKEAQSLSYIQVKLIAGVQLKEQVFKHLLALSIDWHQRKSMGAVITAMQRGINASNMVVQYLFLYLFPTLFEATVVAVVFVQAFGAPLLSSVAITGCVLYISLTIELTNFRMQFRKRMNKADNEASHKVTDALLNIETVKYFTGEQHEEQRYRTSVDAFKDQAMWIQGSLSFLNASQQAVLNLTLAAALLVSAHSYNQGDFTIGQFVAVNVYVMQLFAPLNFMGTIYSMAVGSYVDLQNLCNLLAEKPDIEDRAGAQSLLHRSSRNRGSSSNSLQIEFRNVVFAYPTRKEVNVLKGISFIIPQGTTTAVVGATGAGKSTLSKLLFRFYEPNRGQVLLGGKNVLDLTQQSLRENIGVVPQDPGLFNDTLEYNIRYGARRRGAAATDDGNAVERAVEAAQLEDFVSELPEGLQTIVGERGQQLSGGQKQRIAIARVFMKDCPVVILDEATSSLDSRTEQQIQASLECLQGKTMLVIAHRLSTVQTADQIIVMSKGKILELGSHDALLAKGTWHPESYASLWEKQKKAE